MARRRRVLHATAVGALGVRKRKILYSVEFQKRGLPHAHILVWLKGDHSKMEFSPLSQLRQGTTIWRIRVYVSRLWQHRGGTDHGTIKHTDMVLLDAQGNHMYAKVPEKNVDSFINRIEEGKIYDIRKFLVFPRKYVFKSVEGHSMIKITKRTKLVERTGMEAEFPFCTYALTPIAHLPRPADMPERFTGDSANDQLLSSVFSWGSSITSFPSLDVIGLITGISEAIQYVSASRTEPSTKRVIHLKDLTGHQITVILWGEAALNFEADEVMELGSTDPFIVILVGTLVKTYDGHRGVSGSAACRWYINEDLPDIRDFRNRLRDNFTAIQHINLPGQTAAEVDARVNLETKTVRELANLDMFDNRDARFFCTAVLSRHNPSQRWWFSSCTTCHKSSLPDGTAYRCSDPACVGIDVIPR
ncbi:hypothetical protein VPH35_122552 [Triticum aestivum]